MSQNREFLGRQCCRCKLVGEINCVAAADVITPDDVFDVLEEDVRDADMILWVGISFQQSASTAYFRRVRGYLQASRTQCMHEHAIG